MMYLDRIATEQELIRKAYDFEVEAIANLDNTKNPYFDAIHAMADGEEVWEAISEAVEMAFN